MASPNKDQLRKAWQLMGTARAMADLYDEQRSITDMFTPHRGDMKPYN